jgi:hypothetical protein
MKKRKGESQIGNSTPNHKPLERRGQMSFDWAMIYVVEKIFLRDIR